MTYPPLDIPSFVQESIARVKAEQEIKRTQDAEAMVKRAVENSRLYDVIERRLGYISAELNYIVAQSADVKELLAAALKRGKRWKNINGTSVVEFPNPIYASFPQIVKFCFVREPDEKGRWEIVLASHYDGQDSWWPIGDKPYGIVTEQTVEELDALTDPRALIEKIIRVALS